MDGNRFGNWIEDENPFKLPQPPEWVLLKLWNFDERLVLVPSRRSKFRDKGEYILAIRQRYTAQEPEHKAIDLSAAHPDTNMLKVRGLIPIAPLHFRNGVAWTEPNVDGLLAQLKARDTWALSGGPEHGERAAEAVETHERGIERKEHANLRDKFYHMGRDAYRSLKARTGQRSKRASDYHGAAKLKSASGGST